MNFSHPTRLSTDNFRLERNTLRLVFSLRAGSHVGIVSKGAGEKNGARKSEPARELLIFEFPAFAEERSDPIG